MKGKIFYIWDSGAHLGSRCALGRKHCPTREDQSLQAGLRPRKTQLSPTALQLPTAYLSACKRDSTRRGERRRARRRRRRRRKDLAPPPQLHGASPLLSAARLGWAGLTRVWSPLPGFSAVRWDPGCPWTIPCGLLWSGGGFGGTAAASLLKSWAIPFVLVDVRDAFHHNVAALRAAVESGKSFVDFHGHPHCAGPGGSPPAVTAAARRYSGSDKGRDTESAASALVRVKELMFAIWKTNNLALGGSTDRLC